MSKHLEASQERLTIAIIGVGYVGLPLALAFAQHDDVIGYDIDEQKIGNHRRSSVVHQRSASQSGRLTFTSDPEKLNAAQIYIITVPTPVDDRNEPDLQFLEDASRVVGSKLTRGKLVIYESTVYPGLTEEICVPILEEASGLVCGRDFRLGYSPERINPGDQQHRLENTVKIVAGYDAETLNAVAALYEKIVAVGVYRAESIQVAEAAKMIENAQRDLNIAFMNECAMMFHHMGIDTKAVLAASATKWNFVKMTPGLVGGHCIGVDSYYLAHRAARKGYRPELLVTGRQVNESMGSYIAQQTIKQLVRLGANMHQLRVAVLGVTYKENSADMRNSKVKQIIDELTDYGVELMVADPVADPELAKKVLGGIPLTDIDSITDVAAVILAVPHAAYTKLTMEHYLHMYGRSTTRLMVDVKGLYEQTSFEPYRIQYWRL